MKTYDNNFLGTCRYIGPIQETYISPEIFIGVELDEKLTQNSGIFGSKKYFDCEFGYGLMVPVEKVRNLTTKQTQNFTKSMSLNRAKASTMQNPSTYGLSDDEDTRSESMHVVPPVMMCDKICFRVFDHSQDVEQYWFQSV